jgi:L-alanine-DL-glutamate epimerase-like enolase superfamily enzyme
VPQSLYQRVANLDLVVEEVALEPLLLEGGPFPRRTTVVKLRGGGLEGVGEDITYVPEDQVALQEAFLEGRLPLPLTGATTLDGFSRRLDGVKLFPQPPVNHGPHLYRRWAFESAALDLALRQAKTSLAAALGREAKPVTFAVSRGLGRPASFAPAAALRERVPGARFKLDLDASWDDALMAQLAETDAVDVVDFKGHYRGSFTGLTPDAELYQRAVEAFPTAWIEDPWIDDSTRPVLEAHFDRVTWDAPIHSLADVLQLPFEPRCLNMKPSRFGLLSELFRTYGYCEARGIAMYGGGQFELGPGRRQAQALASLFHPDGPNDLSPVVYHGDLPEAPPTSPLPAPGDAPGFDLHPPSSA